MKHFILATLVLGLVNIAQAQTQTAVFAGGCFWCTEADFEKLPGVISATSGYTGGSSNNPTYKKVTGGNTGHYEAVEVVFDPAKVSYRELLDYFWKTIDPTNDRGQFCDIGSSYRSAVFFNGAEQQQHANESLALIKQNKPFTEPVKTPLIALTKFWPAEKYHQDYYKKNPIRYRFYRNGCGRDARLKKLWGSTESKK